MAKMKESLYDFCMRNEDKRYLLDEWNYEKNELTPKEVGCKTKKVAWWMCEKGHNYDMRIDSRFAGQNCPYCKSKRIIVGYNDLATTHPQLLKFWDFEKNIVKPTEVSKGKNIKVWWKCSNGHSYETTINNRTKERNNHDLFCPICTIENKSSFPEQALYFYIKQYFPSASSQKKIFFNNIAREFDIFIPELSIALEYDGYVWHKDKEEVDIKKNVLCKENNIRLIRVREKGLNSLENSITIIRRDNTSDSSLNEVIKQVLKTIGISDKFKINVEKDRQLIYSQYILQKKENNLSMNFPEIAQEWHPIKNGKLTPDMFNYDSCKKVWWLCKKGHAYQQTINYRTRLGVKANCPYCLGKKVLVGFNDLATTHPYLLKEWDFEKNIIKPTEISRGSIKKIYWKCENNHSWLSTANNRTRNLGKCPICNGIKRIKRYNVGLFISHPHLKKEWDFEKNNINPEKITAGSNKKVWWKCEKGHSYETTINNRTDRRTKGCPYCNGNQILVGYNDLATTHPNLIKEWNYEKNIIKPIEVSKGQNIKVWWKCKKGHSFEMAVNVRTRSSNGTLSGCPYCNGKKILIGYNDLATTHPKLLKEWNYEKNELSPQEVSKGMNKKVWWKCDKGHEWEMEIVKRIKCKSGCPICRKESKNK